MNSKYEKYFVIGFNKTGTASCDELFKKNGLNSYHGGIKWKIEKWQDQLDSYDCFSDVVWTMDDIEYLDKKYPNAIFILNCRNIDKWLISRFKHGLRAFNKTRNHPYYPCTEDKIKKWTNDRDSFHLNLLEYFSTNSKKLIIINIEIPGWMEHLCSLFNFKNNIIKPKNIHNTNLNNKQHTEIIDIVNKTLIELDYNKDTVLISDSHLLDKYIKIYKTYL